MFGAKLRVLLENDQVDQETARCNVESIFQFKITPSKFNTLKKREVSLVYIFSAWHTFWNLRINVFRNHVLHSYNLKKVKKKTYHYPIQYSSMICNDLCTMALYSFLQTLCANLLIFTSFNSVEFCIFSWRGRQVDKIWLF